MGEDCLVTVDGNDFDTDKQGNVKISWDHKFGNSGLDYEFCFLYQDWMAGVDL